ncbi:MAG: TonB-dependent receptor [Bacteroidetes bacterium]|nr:TonB-dependent receptor [Bacteroidota bacterium]
MQKKREPLTKIYWLMRFTSMQFLIAILTLSCLHANNSNAQEILNQQITLNSQNVQLKKVLNQIEQQAKVDFTYSSQKISANQKVSLTAQSERLETVLAKLFTPISIEYKIFNDRTIVLSKSTKSMGDMELPPVRGKVTDEEGNPLIGATVSVKGGTNGTTTDVDGNFSLDVPDGAILVVSYTGYATQEVTVSGSGPINVTLAEGVLLDNITVIGSRGKPRTDLDSPVPIDAIQASDLLKTGQPDIAQSIHFTVPSFSAQKFGINDLAPLIDPAQLRGLGSDQTLLTVNGKRRHKVAFFNGNDGVGKGQLGNDINSIPSAAVERVEVLRDGAAALYGSDAIAGVINMELKKNRSGGSLMAYLGSTYTSPEYDGVTNKGEEGAKIYGDDAITDGNTFSTSLNFGLPWGDDGFISTTLSYSHADPTDRSGTYSHSSGWYTSAQYDSLGLTDEQLQAQNGIDKDRAILGTAENTNGGLFINAGKSINDTWDYYGMAGFTKKHIIGGVFTRTPARTSRAVVDIFYDGYNPEVPSTLTDWQALSGIKGELGGGWTADFSMGYSGNDVQLFARNTVNPSMGADSPTQFYTGGLRVTQSILNFDFTKSLSDNVSLAFGSEYRRETYEQSEGQKESWFPGELATAGRDIGSSGREGYTPASTGFWDRNNLGIYAELEADLTEAFLVIVAGRFEDYSDFGSDFSYKLATRYKVTDNVSVRGSLNRSFRAPSLAQTHYSNFSQISFGGDGESIVSPTLPIRDTRVQSAFGIENLQPETSFDIAVGATAKLMDGALKLTLDAYQIAVDDRIFLAQVAAADFPVFGTSGFDDINFFTNAINTTTSGLDFVATYSKRFSENNNLNLSLAVNFNETEIDELNPTKELAGHISYDRINNGSDFFVYLIEGTPKSKIIFSPSYRTGPVSFLARISNFGEVSEPRLRYNADNDEWDDNPVGGGEPQILSAKTVVDFSITGHFSDNLSITAGVNNLFDTYPDMLAEAQVRSEVIYSRRVNQFGTNGRFLNLTLNYNW